MWREIVCIDLYIVYYLEKKEEEKNEVGGDRRRRSREVGRGRKEEDEWGRRERRRMGRKKTKILTFYTMFIKYYNIFSKYNDCYKFFLCISPKMCCSLYIVKIEIRNFKVIKLSRNYTYYNVNILSFIIKLCFYSMFFYRISHNKTNYQKDRL